MKNATFPFDEPASDSPPGYISKAASFFDQEGMRFVFIQGNLIFCVEHLRRDDPVKLGRILGLDRAPEVKTLRRKLTRLASKNHAVEWMEALGRAPIKSLKLPPKCSMWMGMWRSIAEKIRSVRRFRPSKTK